MTRRTATIAPDYFDELYATAPDPWAFRTSTYEHGKYDATLAALRRPRYRSALEVGCSIGVFTARLATRCDAVLAIDASAVAVEEARQCCAKLGNLRFERAMVPAQFPAGSFDLIVLSEVLYYLTPADLRAVAARCAEALTPDGDIVLCHWLGETDYPLTGVEAHDLFVGALREPMPIHAILNRAVYRLDRLSRA